MKDQYGGAMGHGMMHKNRNDQKIKQMPPGVKHYLAPAPEHKPVYVECERQKIKTMPIVSHFVGGGGTRNIVMSTKAPNQKIR